MPSRLLAIWSSGHPVIRTSGHPAIWSFCHLTIWSSRLLVIWSSRLLAIWSSGHPVIQPSGHLTVRSSDHPVIWSSRVLAIWSSDHPVTWPSGHLSWCLKNVLIGIFLAYLIVGYTNLKFLTSSLRKLVDSAVVCSDGSGSRPNLRFASRVFWETRSKDPSHAK